MTRRPRQTRRPAKRRRAPEALVIPAFREAYEHRVMPVKAAAGERVAAKPTPLPYQPPLEPTIFKRRRLKKPKSLSTRALSAKELRAKVKLNVYEEPARVAKRNAGLVRRGLPVLQMPALRAGCAAVPRPCPFVRCSMNNYLDVTEKGAVKINFPDLEPGQMDPHWSCASDVADRGGATVEEVAYAVNLGLVRTRKIEAILLGKLKETQTVRDLAESYGGRRGHRRDADAIVSESDDE